MNDDELQNRLRSMGVTPIDPEVQAGHLRQVEAVGGAGAEPAGRRRFGPVAVGAAAIFGFLAGSTGLAMAGALPDQAQGVAHDVLGVVQVDVPEGKDGKRGPCVAAAAKLDDEVAKQAAKDACPQGNDDPGPVDEDGDGKPDKPDKVDKHADDPCRGKPAWTGPMSNEEREAAKAASSRDTCVDDDGDDKPDKPDKPDKVDKHADDPCRGKPAWTGPMSNEEREAAKTAASRDTCVDDDGEDVEEPDVEDSVDG